MRSPLVAGSLNDRSLLLSADDQRILRRTRLSDDAGDPRTFLVAVPSGEHPTASSLGRLTHEFALRDELDADWAAKPLELVRDGGRHMLVLDDPGGEPLDPRVDGPMEIRHFLSLATGISHCLGQMHQRGLIHKDVKPSNILVTNATGEVRLTGFGIASRLPRERQAPQPLEVIVGTFAYMAPEQTGRMNRSIDARSDLYALGVTFYEMLTGTLPFTAQDPMEWVHCHLARQPRPPSELRGNIPEVLSAIILRLLSKAAEDRYQTAAGLEYDLRACCSAWDAHRQILDFPLGLRDASDRLMVPEKLYGRESEVEALLAAFDRVARTGTPELVLVSGYSGIGKSSLVNELQPVLVPPRALFASGKFDQYKRDIPYSTLAEAFLNLIRPLLFKAEADLKAWRQAIEQALGPNAQLITDLVPDLRLIIGESPPVPELPPQDAQRRFQLVLRRFISVFAQPDHPLALFLDDLQWLDAATLALLEDLVGHSDARHMLLIGAYRDNEVSTDHPLMRAIDRIREAGVPVEDIVLSALTPEHTQQLVADTLHHDAETGRSLARLIHDKTGGNPFFVIQFLGALAEEDLLKFNQSLLSWNWDLPSIQKKDYTDNIVDLMVSKVKRLPARIQRFFVLLSCLGNSIELSRLALVYGGSIEDSRRSLQVDLQEAQQSGLVLLSEGVCRFLHDRVHEAAYSLIPAAARAASHLRIGRLLAARLNPAQRDDSIFELVSQLNRGSSLIESSDELEQLAEYNLIAGTRAKASGAFRSALRYFATGSDLLADKGWQDRPDLMFTLELHLAECEFLTSDMDAADARLSKLAERDVGPVEQASVVCQQIDLYITLDRIERAIDVALSYLRDRGLEWQPHPTESDARHAFEQTWSRAHEHQNSELLALPVMSTPIHRATLDVLNNLVSPALYTDRNLLSLVICRMIDISLEHGNTDSSCAAYAWFSIIAGSHFGEYRGAVRFGQLSYDLVEQSGLERFKARTYMLFGNLVMPWTRHVGDGRELIRRALALATLAGDLTFGAYCRNNWISNLLAGGDPLAEVEREAELGLTFADEARFGLVIDIMEAQLGLIHTLRGSTERFGCLTDKRFDEVLYESDQSRRSSLPLARCWYWIRKLQGRFFAGDYAAAIDASENARRLLWTSSMFLESAEAHFYGALSILACCDMPSSKAYRAHASALAEHHKQLLGWAAYCPANFDDRASLVGAEIARIEGRLLDAEALYERAIKSARKSGFVHNEAIANETAARFYRTRGFETIARAYLREARSCYQQWGATAKVRQLETLHPFLSEPERPNSAGTITAPVGHLEYATVVKVWQTISAEVDLTRLIDALLRLAIEHAGAERGLLLLSRGDGLRPEAEALTGGDGITVRRRDEATPTFPDAIVQYVNRTRHALVIDDASADATFSGDTYLRERNTKSILCLPLATETKLVGVLYLENSLARSVFSPGQVAVLKLLALQAAFSLENAYLYSDLALRESRIRRLVDGNVVGIMFANLRGDITDCNDVFLEMLGYERGDVTSGALRWLDLTPAEWHEVDGKALELLQSVGTVRPYEKEFRRKNGSRIRVLLGATMFDEVSDEGVAFVLDLTPLRQAEQAARESEERLQETQLELAHANRIATMGQLTASITHEVGQPLSGILLNAHTARRIAGRLPLDVARVEEKLNLIIRDVGRATEIVARTRELGKKAPAVKANLEIGEVIMEVLELARRELSVKRVHLQTRLAQGLPRVQGNRVQLQQVMLNLIMNAIEAMIQVPDGHRELLVSTGSEAEFVVVSFQDSGPGLSAGDLGQMFDAFYTTKPTGLGLGLSICRSIVEAHGGRLWASSNAQRGTVFNFTVPFGGAECTSSATHD